MATEAEVGIISVVLSATLASFFFKVLAFLWGGLEGVEMLLIRMWD